jgi:hypothetical protein
MVGAPQNPYSTPSAQILFHIPPSPSPSFPLFSSTSPHPHLPPPRLPPVSCSFLHHRPPRSRFPKLARPLLTAEGTGENYLSSSQVLI